VKRNDPLIVIGRGEEVFEIQERLPLLPLRDVVIFPYMTIPLLIGRPPSINAVEEALTGDRIVFVSAQKRADIADPGRDDVYRIGSVVRVLQLFRLPDGAMRVLVEGICRAQVRRFYETDDYYTVRISPLPESLEPTPELEAAVRNVLTLFTEYVHLNRRLPDEVLTTVNAITDPVCLTHTMAAYMVLKVPQKQELLEAADVTDRLTKLRDVLTSEIEILQLEKKIEGQVRTQVHKNQKEFYLTEQLKAIRKELGYPHEFSGEVDDLTEQAKKADLPDDIRDRVLKELDKIAKMSFMSPEATVGRNYVDWLLALPWKTVTEDVKDIAAVEKVLDEDHFGLRKVKERIVEHLAVLQLSGSPRGPLLCFLGPPGVGKTSLGRSIARALGRKFVRMSLGGVRDEAEIRGHRRTYIGSLPGRIIQGMKRAGSKNPVFLLDEIDKLGADYRGDPSSALLEVLDPEQNFAFNDHYLEVDFDLSQVMFLTTANSLQGIPPALIDRMEILRLPGYLEHEKVQIAKKFLLPKQVAAAGLKAEELNVPPASIYALVRNYTREAGVRNLEREIATICRKVAKTKAKAKGADGTFRAVRLGPASLRRYLGVPKFLDDLIVRGNRVGVATGLAWTEVGGEVLTVEASVLPGKGELVLTGKLGEVMRESGQAALSYARSRASVLGLARTFYKDVDIHVNLPEAAIAKDGPSAGITIAVAMISALTGVPTRADVAMTGEITLRGSVLPIGGLLEKTVAARRAGIRTVIIPKLNEKDIPELPKEVRRHLTLVPVETMDEVLDVALLRAPSAGVGADTSAESVHAEPPRAYAH
jgi:ATP-dependent Lon protease